MDELLVGLAPRMDVRTRVLILGSMPGTESLCQGRYYAHARNRFWPLMSSMFGIPAEFSYEERICSLNDAGIGLWDVIATCKRKGSLDTGICISSEAYNDFNTLLLSYPGISNIYCNGSKAYVSFTKNILPGLNGVVAARLEVFRLPSTSPANASSRLDDLLRSWSAAFNNVHR